MAEILTELVVIIHGVCQNRTLYAFDMGRISRPPALHARLGCETPPERLPRAGCGVQVYQPQEQKGGD
jgi:hypothetical protein